MLQECFRTSRGRRTGRRLALTLALAVGAAAAPGLAAAPDDFAGCVARLQVRAHEDGISEPVVREVLGGVAYRERIIELDRRQPEFTATFADYLGRRVTPERVILGRVLLETHRGLLEKVQKEYGVPAHYLVAFWGMETNFGAYFGDVPVPDSLATLACDPRRSEFFTAELLSALRIVDAGDIAPEQMVGSWAGAMGHMQFLPSVFLRFAVDGDGDGRRDVWHSLPDAFASAGHFLASLGWQSGYLWGREVALPPSFDFSLAGADGERPLTAWAALGVRDARGNSLPAVDLPASLLVPAGHDGPAFLTYHNFDVIMRWNRSEYYALAVGYFADRINGGAALVREPPESKPLRVEAVRRLQADLARLGYEAGEADGIPGPATRRAVSRFQQDRRLIADGHLDPAVVAAVRDAAASLPAGDGARANH